MLNNDIGQDLCQISLTGLRSLILLGLLIQAPRSLEEIKQEFLKYKVTEESSSYDIIRIDINTLKAIGCEISRADKRTNNKYVLLKQPFELNINEDEIKLLKRAYNKVKENFSVETLFQCNELFKKIADQISDIDLKERLVGISSLKKYNMEEIRQLLSDCKNKNTLLLNYKSPASNTSSEKEIIAQKLVCKNDKIYLYGFDKEKQESVTLNIKRILKILSRKHNDNTINSNPVTIKFKLTTFGVSGLEDNEKILCGDVRNGFVIEGSYHNLFIATQRILSFGPACTVYEPQDFKEYIIKTLKEMKEIYND